MTGYEDEAHVRIRHRPCGREYILPLNARGLTKRQLCDKCNYKYRDRIGRKATMNSGETCRIIAYRSSMDLDVEFEDGAIAKHTTYTNFKLGMIGRPDDTPEEQAKRRLGEKRTMNCGLEAEIIRYGAYADIDVRFEDGYIARHAAYKEFLNGSIRPPIDRVGETGIMNNGLKATIIAYRKHIDMDVLFEDGSVAEHIDYKNFTEGRVARPQDSRRNRGKFRIGEKRIMKCGLEAEIISYRKNDDMDVRFPDGVIVKNVQYTNFKRGMVGHP